MKNIKKKQAFTLFEVLIALAILSISMVAGMMTTDNVLQKTLDIEQKILAHWAGMNILNSMELKLLKDELEVSQTSGQSVIRGQEFDYNLKITKIKVSDVELLNMKVIMSSRGKFNQNNTSQQLETIERNVPLK